MRLLIIILIIVLILAVVLVIGGRIYSSNVPTPAGVGIGVLALCPESPNCVSTLATDDLHKVEPLKLNQNPQDDITVLAAILMETPKTRIITKNETYLHVEMRSSLWNFIDDVEFLVDEEAGLIHSRSAARLGYSDMGVNRSRYKKISAEYAKRSGN